MTARINVIGTRCVVAVEHIVAGSAGADLHQLIAGFAQVPNVEVGSIVLAVTFPLHIYIDNVRSILLNGEVEVVRGDLPAGATVGVVSGVVGGIDLGVRGKLGFAGDVAAGRRLRTSINRLIGPLVRAGA
jgi:hypothetical protein